MAGDRRDTVQLGCGTLILIAIIVLIFSGGNSNQQLARDVRSLRQEVLVLQEKIDILTHALEAIQPSQTPPQGRGAPPTAEAP